MKTLIYSLILFAGRSLSLLAASTMQFEFTRYPVREDAGEVLIGVVRNGDSSLSASVEYTTLNGNALSGTDYTGVTNVLTFAAGEAVRTFTVPILNDALKEPIENFRITLQNPTGGSVLGSRIGASVAIQDNDPGVQFEYRRYAVGEDAGTATIQVLRGRDVEEAEFTVDYATSPESALRGRDYAEAHGTLHFPPHVQRLPIDLPVYRNDASAADLAFKVSLSNPSSGAWLGTNPIATITVLDTSGIQPHLIRNARVLPDARVELEFAGAAHRRYQTDFDLYPLEVSADLKTWTLLTLLQRANTATNALTYTFPASSNSTPRFFRTARGPLPTPYRLPGGPYPVGTHSRLVQDPNRRNRFGISTNNAFMVTVWYPAAPAGGSVPDAYVFPRDNDPAWRADPESTLARLHGLTTPTFEEAPWAALTNYPVILYSVGATGTRSARLELGPHLASHGYVFVTMDHPDTAYTTFPDGVLRSGDTELFPTDRGYDGRMQDFEVVYERLQQWNQTDPIFAGRLNFDQLGTIGFSWGGGVAAEFARLHSEVRAVVLLDSYLQNANDLLQSGLSTPFLAMFSSEAGGEGRLFDNPVAKDATTFLIRDSFHEQFSDYYWFNFPSTPSANREIARTIQDWTLWFMNTRVRNSSDPEPAVAEYPRVLRLRRKGP